MLVVSEKRQTEGTLTIVDEQDLLLVARRWSRRSQYTSVERFLDFFPNASVVASKHALQRPYRLLHWLSQRADHDGYTSHSVGLELAALWQILIKRPRIVHFLYADHDYHYLAMIAQYLGIKTVGSFWFSVEEFEQRMPRKLHLHYLDLVIASGQAQMAYLSDFVPRSRLAYLPLGVDTRFFSPPANPEQRWQGTPRLLQVGVNRRDFDTLYHVFCRLRTSIPDVELHMVGCQEVESQFEGEAGIIFHAFLADEDLLRLYHRSRLLILPLKEGGSSNALNEALSVGLPIVATDVQNLRDYVTAECVSLCPPYDVDAMTAACLQLLYDKPKAKTASAASRQLALTFDWNCIRTDLLACYKRLLVG